ncbi:hypothetical protein ACP275_14G041500 [Erythranthe tilingii]
MAAFAMRFFFALLAFVTVGMIIGAFIQLTFIRKLEESYGDGPSLTRIRGLSRGISHWEDKEAAMLRLGYVKPEIVSWSPRVVVFHNFLSAEECDYLRAIAKPRLQVSTVVDTKTGKGVKSTLRTSSGMFVSVEERMYPMIQAIEKRISVYSQVPVENGERIQVLRSTGMKRISFTGRTTIISPIHTI